MLKTVLQIDGMMCGMCESYLNDAVRSAFAGVKVTSSHTKKETVILSREPLDEETLRAVIAKTGYTVLNCSTEPYEKKSLFSGWFRKKQ